MRRRGPGKGARAGRALVVALLATAAVGGWTVPEAQAADGSFTWISTECEGDDAGASDPTFYASNRRVVVTERGREIVVYDAHGAGEQIKWRDPGGSWQRRSTGAADDGYLGADLPNDRPASLALARDSNGVEHVWLVWAGYHTEGQGLTNLALSMRRLSSLDSSQGPRIGPEVEVAPPGMGNVRPDVAFEGRRGVIAWVQRGDEGRYDLKATWFTDLDTDRPRFVGEVELDESVPAETTPTLVPSPDGMRIVVQAGGLDLYTRAPDDPLTSWRRAVSDVPSSNRARPSAVALDSGDVLAAFESAQGGVGVVRFGTTGAWDMSLPAQSGYRDPALTTDGRDAWLVAVRVSDGYVVSRHFNSGAGWTEDVVEVAEEGGFDYRWPNLIRRIEDGKLRLLLDAVRCPKHGHRNWVAAYERTVAVAPSPRLYVGDVRVSEGGSRAHFVVALSRTSGETVTVAFATSDGSAVAPSDYAATSGALHVPPGTTTATIAIAIAGDKVDEPNESFSVRLSGATNATIADARGDATIVDDDRTPTSVSLRARRGRDAIRVRGRVWPSLSGRKVVTSLWRKRGGRFVKLASNRSALRARDGSSVFATRFPRPRPGTCKVTAWVMRTETHAASRSSRVLRC